MFDYCRCVLHGEGTGPDAGAKDARNPGSDSRRSPRDSVGVGARLAVRHEGVRGDGRKEHQAEPGVV